MREDSTIFLQQRGQYGDVYMLIIGLLQKHIFKIINVCKTIFYHSWYFDYIKIKNMCLHLITHRAGEPWFNQSCLTADIWLREECGNTICHRSKRQPNQLRYARVWHR